MENGVTFKQVYNAENRISSILRLRSGTCEANPLNIEAQWDFAYDGDGVRTVTLETPYDENGQPLTSEAQLTSYYFGGAYETRSDGSTLKYYSFAGQMVAMRDGEGLKYMLSDHLGSMVAITDDSGTLITQQRYLPFGGERQLSNYPTTELTDYAYTGQRALNPGMGGLMDYKARFYSPYINRFLQPDSLIPDANNPQAWNRYSYVANRPINLNDPTGHCFEPVVV